MFVAKHVGFCTWWYLVTLSNFLSLSLSLPLSLSLSSPPECWANHWTNHCSGLPVFPQQVVGICGVITCDSGFRVVKDTNLSNQAPPLRDRSGDRAGKLSVYLTLRLVGCCSSLGGGNVLKVQRYIQYSLKVRFDPYTLSNMELAQHKYL